MPSNTPNLNLYKKNPATDGTDTFNIEEMINENLDKIDAEFGATTGHGHTGAAGDGPKITSAGLAAGSATDTIIGNRTIVDTEAPADDIGTPTKLWGWLAYMIKAITGKSSWRTAPATTLEAAKVHADDTDRHITASERTTWNGKASTAAATPAAAGLMSAADKSKLDGVATGANNYTHPTGDGNQHVPATGTTNNTKVLKAGATAGSATWGVVNGSEVVEDTTHRFTTDAKQVTWDAKETTAGAQTKADAAQSAAVAAAATDASTKANAVQANLTAHIGTGGNAHADVTTTADGFMTAADKVKLDGVAVGANNYAHPATHPATMITEDTTHRFATDTEKTAWNAKASTAAATPSAAGLMSAADKTKLDGVAAGANAYVHPNHTGDVTSSGDGVTAIAPGVIVNADINAVAAIDATKIGTGVVSNAEFGYLDGVTSAIQAQINGKASTAAATSGSAGLMPAADKAKLDAVTNPWGDNTDTTRSAGDMSRAGSIGQGIPASALSKMIFTFAANNQKSTCDIPNSRFVIPETGYYLVNARVGITGGSTYNQLLLYINGSINAVLAESSQNAGNISGASILRLQAGWTLEFYVFVNANTTISPNPESTQVSLIRVA